MLTPNQIKALHQYTYNSQKVIAEMVETKERIQREKEESIRRSKQ